MKIRKDKFVLRQITDEYLVIPIGEYADRDHNMMSLSSSGAFLWRCLEGEQTVDSLTDALTGKYDVDKDTARSAVEGFLASIRQNGCLEE